MRSHARRFLHLAPLLVATTLACSGGDRYAGMDAEALFRLAENEMAEGEHGNAIEALDRLRISFSDWERIADAQLMIADAYFAQGDYLTARSEYQRFRDRFVGSELAPVAALGECRALSALSPQAERDQTHTRDAITICTNVTVDYAGTAQADTASALRQELRHTMAEKEFLNANHYFRRDQFDPAIKYFQFVVDLYPETEFASRALLGLYRSNLEIGYDDLAEEARDRLLSEYPESPEAAELRSEGPES